MVEDCFVEDWLDVLSEFISMEEAYLLSAPSWKASWRSPDVMIVAVNNCSCFSLWVVLEIGPGVLLRQFDATDWKEYFCVLEREPPTIRIFLDEQVYTNIQQSSGVISNFPIALVLFVFLLNSQKH